MKNILLVLSATGTPDEVIDYAVKRAKAGPSTLVAVYLLEANAASEVFDTFTDIGFIGDRPSTQLSESIMKEYRQRGYEELGKVQIKAMEEGVDFEPLMEEGEAMGKVLSIIKRLDIGTAVAVKKKRKAFFKYFSRSFADELREKAHCEVIVFTEEASLM